MAQLQSRRMVACARVHPWKCDARRQLPSSRYDVTDSTSNLTIQLDKNYVDEVGGFLAGGPLPSGPFLAPKP